MSNMTNREATWAKVGTDVKSARTIDEVLTKAGMDFNVEKQNIYLADGTVVSNKFATVSDKGNIYGIVGNNYTICNNREAFDFVNYIDEEISFIKAGETATGISYVIASLPNKIILGDNITPHLIFQNSFDGSTTIKAAIVPLRVACQNQFAMAFRKSDNTVSIRHCMTLKEKMEEAKEIICTTISYMDNFEKEAEMLASTKVADWKVKQIIENFFPIKETATEGRVLKVLEKRDKLFNMYKSLDDNQNFKGTAWGIVNAYADMATHEKPDRLSKNWEETKFMKTTFNPYMQDFIKLVKQAA